MLDALCSALSVRSAVVQIVQESASASWEAWTSRDTHSTIHAGRHDSCLNRPDSPRFQLLPGHVPRAEISSDQRSFGARPDLIDDLRGRMAQAELGIGLPLPCNVCVWEDGGGSVVSIARPEVMFDLVKNDALRAVASGAEDTAHIAAELAILGAWIGGAVLVGSVTLRRRTP